MFGEGTTIGAYRVLRKLGEGGMGAVYLAEHALLGRRAAIKVLLPALSENEEFLRRFFNEARAITQIADPGIVQVFDFGQTERGLAFIVMELLDGETMDGRLARLGRFQPLDCLRLMRQICASLGAAHHKGIVHRDLKPENVFLVGDPAITGGERVKLLDFGIAKLSSDEPTTRTRTGVMMGTPVYMSPEQCRGAADLDARSDIYASGCLLMTMLTGRPPFEAESSGELIAAHLREPPPLAASRLPGLPPLPPLFDQILQRCLAKAPADRFPSMAELARALAIAEQVVLQATVPAPLGELAADPSRSFQLPQPGAHTPLPSTPTTLTGSSGQVASVAPARKRWLGYAAAAAAAAVVVGAGALVATRGGSGHAPAAPPSVPAAAQPRVPPQHNRACPPQRQPPRRRRQRRQRQQRRRSMRRRRPRRAFLRRTSTPCLPRHSRAPRPAPGRSACGMSPARQAGPTRRLPWQPIRRDRSTAATDRRRHSSRHRVAAASPATTWQP